MRSGLSSIAVIFSLVLAASALTIPVERSSAVESLLETLDSRILIGYNGFNGVIRPPQASGGGELGAVFYVADAVDLAKFFANGADHTKDFVCLIHADAKEWGLVPKVWVPANILAGGGGAVNKYAPGAVVFAAHALPPLPPGAPAAVYQLGVRQAQIDRLKLSADCKPKANFANDHQTLGYPGLDAAWSIQRPPFWVAEQWRGVLMNLVGWY